MRTFTIFLVFLGLLHTSVYAQSLKDGVSDLARQLMASELRANEHRQILLEVTNYYSQEKDLQTKALEQALFQVLTEAFPTHQLLLKEESLTGISLSQTIFLKTTYEPRGNRILLRMQAIEGMDGRLIVQAETEFDAAFGRKRTLVAVLDIDSQSLSDSERRAYSDIFRTALSELDIFELASSADVDKMNPDAIQRATGCTRDECATIIGEQLGVDRVISVSLATLSKNNTFISAKIINIQDGAILLSRSVQHQESLQTLPDALYKLAGLLTGKTQTRAQVSQNMDSAFIWHVLTTGILVSSMFLGYTEAQAIAELADENKRLKNTMATTESKLEYEQSLDQYEKNTRTIETHEQNARVFDVITLTALGIESYLLWSQVSPSGNKIADSFKTPVHLGVIPTVSRSGYTLSFRWNW